jgi:hypothetical protein
MKRFVFMALVVAVVFTASAASAALLEIPNLSGVSTYNGYYVGPIGATLDSKTIMDGVVCNDYATTTLIPASFAVYVGNLSIPDLTNAKFGNDAAALLKYQQAAALLYEIRLPANSGQVGAIQYAIWNIFNPSTPDPENTSNWVAWAVGIVVADWNFDSVNVYSATNTTNQEFMSGAALPQDNTPVPIPPTVYLLGAGLLGLVGLRRKFKK